MAGAHALLSASSAHRWLVCTPSARLEEKFPDAETEYAKEGTLAHEIAAYLALSKTGQITAKILENMWDDVKYNEYYSADMVDHCEGYAEYVYDRWQQAKKTCPDANVLIEAKIEYDQWAPEGFGTADCIILSDDTLEVIDFKYGKGKKVSAYNNPQMRLYALGAYNTYGLLYGLENVRMTIYQPRLGDPIQTDIITIDRLLDWGEKEVAPTAQLAWKGEGPFSPSHEVCRFCKVKGTCRARADYNLKVFDSAPEKALLTPDDAGEYLNLADDMKSWLEDLENVVKSALLMGRKVYGWKLVEGRSNRKYKNPAAIAETLIAAGVPTEQIYKPQELINLTALEKLMGKKYVKEYLSGFIEKPKGKPTVAPETDPRDEYVPADEVVKAFEEESENA